MFNWSSRYSLFFFRKQPHIIVFSNSTKTTEPTQPCPQGFSVPVPFLTIACTFDVILLDITNAF